MKNVGTIDKVVRIAAAILIGVLYATNTISGIAAILLVIVAVVLLITSFIGFCPLYRALGINTCRKKG